MALYLTPIKGSSQSFYGAGFIRVLRLSFYNYKKYSAASVKAVKEVFVALSITMNNIRERISLLQSVGVSARALAAVHGISPNKLQNGVDGVVYLGAEVESDLSSKSVQRSLVSSALSKQIFQ